MSISFHCESCKKRIKAPDDAGGKWGNCPHCRHRCYIPSPPDEDEPELTLQPIDENEESQISQMMRETHGLTQAILHQKEVPGGVSEESPAPEAADLGEKELIRLIILYLRQMADGQLDGAQETLPRLQQNRNEAKKILQRMARSERPEPELADIPPRILNGFMKELNSRL